VRVIVEDQLEAQLTTCLNYLLGTCGVAFAGKLDKDFVLAAARVLDVGFFQAEGVDTAANGFERLVHGLLLEVGNDGGLHGHEEAVLFSRRLRKSPFVKLILHQGLQGASGSGRHVANENLRVGDFAYFADCYVLLMKLVVEGVNGLVAMVGDGFLNLHLQDEMAAAAKVKAELHAI